MIEHDNGLRMDRSSAEHLQGVWRLGMPAVLAGVLVTLAGNCTVFAQASGSLPPGVKDKIISSLQSADDCLDNNPADVGPPLKPPVGGPPARFVAETTITLNPHWRGDKIECTFDIANGGEGDLYFKPRRG